MRIEVETAISEGIQILPILCGRTVMPMSSELPQSIQTISTINSLKLRIPERDRETDLSRIVEFIKQTLEACSRPRFRERCRILYCGKAIASNHYSKGFLLTSRYVDT